MKHHAQKIFTIFVGGAADKNDFTMMGITLHKATQLMDFNLAPPYQNHPGVAGVFQAELQKQGKQGRVDYFGYDEKGKIINAIKAAHQGGEIINIVGHSYGGRVAVEVALKLNASQTSIPINFLITLDPVGRLSQNDPHVDDVVESDDFNDFDDQLQLPKYKPQNVTKWINIYAAGRTVTGDDLIAVIGGSWGNNVKQIPNVRHYPAEKANHADALLLFQEPDREHPSLHSAFEQLINSH